jgi:hypothetical protein
MKSIDTLGEKNVYIPAPYFFNLDYKPLSNFISFLNITECNHWYMFDFEDGVPQVDKAFFG